MTKRSKQTFYSTLKPFVLLAIITLSFFLPPVFASQENAITVTANISLSGQMNYVQTEIEGIQINGTTFTLNGQNIRFTGVHMLLWPDSDTRFKEEYFEWLKNWGINTVILDFGWNFLEPTKGNYSVQYLSLMDNFIAKAKENGIYVIIRLQKYPYPYGYQADVQPWPESWTLSFPSWIGHTPGFWENYGNCWNSYVAMWSMLANHYKSENYVAGFGLMTEPGTDIGPGIYDPNSTDWQTWTCGTCRKVMSVLFDQDRLYERTINAIHSVSDKPVIIEGFSYGVFIYLKNAGDSQRSVAAKPNSQNFAIAQSFYNWYQINWLDGDIVNVSRIWNTPCMASEFGEQVAIINSPTPAEISWVGQACQALAQRGMSGFYWQFGPGPDGDFNLVNENTLAISPILSTTLANYSTGLFPAPR